ncbi:MAG: glycosyltransferase family A protein [archaeon]
MSKKIEISIIIPAHNEEKYIKKTLQSIKNSEYKNYEIIVICDNCSDSTEKIAKRYTKKVYSVNLKNTAKSRNLGAKKSKGNILVFNDADTIISKTYLYLIKKAVEKGAEYGTCKWRSETDHWFGRYWAWGNNRSNKKEKTIAGNSFVKKNVFQEVNGFKALKKGEDTDLGNRLKNKGKKYTFIESTYYIPSERWFKHGFMKFWINAIYESWLYNLNKERFLKKFGCD